MLMHRNERVEKCPIPTCEYHTRGFVSKNDKKRHALIHYQGLLSCGFCSSNGGTPQIFGRVRRFKRHLRSAHGIKQTLTEPRRTDRKTPAAPRIDLATCSICNGAFASPQEFYEHLDDCVLCIVQSMSSEAINRMSPTSEMLANDYEDFSSMETPESVASGSSSPRRARDSGDKSIRSVHLCPDASPAVIEGYVDNHPQGKSWIPPDAAKASAHEPRDMRSTIVTESSRSGKSQSPTASWNAQRLAELRDTVTDLQRRTATISRRTSPWNLPTESFAHRASHDRSKRSHSTPPTFSRARSVAVAVACADAQEIFKLEQSPGARKEFSPFSPTPFQTPHSDADASYNRSRFSPSPRTNIRARSEPAVRRKCAATHQNQTAGSSNLTWSVDIQASQDKSSQKREASQNLRQRGNGRKDDNGSAPKRRKIGHPNDRSTDNGRFPCIFHAGEPREYSYDDKRHEYISQLL